MRLPGCDDLDVAYRRANVARAAASIAHLERNHEDVVTQGNAPQVSLLALQAYACRAVPPYPVDVLDAESAGSGYARHGRARRVIDRRSTGRAEA